MPRPGSLITKLPTVLYCSGFQLRRKPNTSLKHRLQPGLAVDIFSMADTGVGGKSFLQTPISSGDLAVLMEQKQLKEKNCLKRRCLSSHFSSLPSASSSLEDSCDFGINTKFQILSSSGETPQGNQPIKSTEPKLKENNFFLLLFEHSGKEKKDVFFEGNAVI